MRQYQNELFDLEKKRQRDAVGRIEKIEVRYLGTPEDTTLVMNKNLSTPFNCAQRKFRFDLDLDPNGLKWKLKRKLTYFH